MSLETWIPLNVTRSSRSFFDPTYDVGLDWDDFGHHKRRLATSGGHSQRSREVHVQRTVDDSNLQRDMDRMFTNFYHLAPYERHVYKPRSPMTRRHLSQHAVSDVSYRCPQLLSTNAMSTSGLSTSADNSRDVVTSCKELLVPGAIGQVHHLKLA